MYWWIAAIVVALAGIQYAALAFQRRDHAFEKSAMGVQALATTLAIMFAGYWYIYERKGQPQANTALEVVGVKVTDSVVALEARFTIDNLGATLLQVGDTDVRLQAMNPDSLPVDALKAPNRADYPDTPAGKNAYDMSRQRFPQTIDGRDAYDDGVLMWPTVKWFRGGGGHSVEPGETDLKIIDFLAPCSYSAMRIYFAMNRPGSDQVWSDTAMLGLSDLCAKPVGTKETLSERKSD